MSAFKKSQGGQALSRDERQAMEDERERKKFPKMAKWGLYLCWVWVAFWGVLLASGIWSSNMYGCTVEKTYWDGVLSNSIIIMSIIGFVILAIQSVWHERNV